MLLDPQNSSDLQNMQVYVLHKCPQCNYPSVHHLLTKHIREARRCDDDDLQQLNHVLPYVFTNNDAGGLREAWMRESQNPVQECCDLQDGGHQQRVVRK